MKENLRICDIMKCPNCGNDLDEDNYCFNCMEFFNDSDDEFDDFYNSDDDFDSFEEKDYDSMINNGDAICLNCTYWSVSPYGAAHGMYCRRGNGETDPDDTCFDFAQSHSFANYGDAGQFQFDETDRDISNKLRYWKNSR